MKTALNKISSKVMTLSKSKGFTLIELLVVIAVLGVLAAAVVAAINPIKKINQAKDSTLKSDMSQLVNALQANVTANNGAYPAAGTPPLQPLVTSQELKSLPKQPNGSDYNYDRSTGTACTTAPYTGCEAVVWGSLSDVSTTTYYCWDSTNNGYTTTTVAPTIDATPTCL